MEHQDWKPVECKPKHSRSVSKIPKQNPPGTSQFRALDSVEPPAPEKLNVETRIAIQQARMSMKLSQKDLANKCSLPVNLISEYENGKAIPERKILNKLAGVLGVKFN